MIQITGLTKTYRKGAPPAVLDLTFDARPGTVTALLGAEGAGKSTALRLMLGLERGQGVTLFDGRPYRRLRRPEREVGVVLPGPGDVAAAVAGHPGHRAQSHLRMLAAAVGVPARRADELLEQTRLAAVAGQRLRAFSPGMHRRLALAAALLGDPGTLLLDAPTEGLSPRNVEWFHAFLRSFAVAGGTVLATTRTAQEASQLADRVVTLDRGRLVADQPVVEFRRTRLSPEVAVRGPQMARLADLLVSQGADVRRDGSVGLAVAGIDRTEIGELAYRHGILLHELADRVVEQPAPRVVLPAASGRSGHLRVRPAPEAEPAPEPAVETTSGAVRLPAPAEAPATRGDAAAAKPAANPAAEATAKPAAKPGAALIPATAPAVLPAPLTEPGATPKPGAAPECGSDPETVPGTTPATTPESDSKSDSEAVTARQRRAPRRRGDVSLPARALPVAVTAAALPVLGAPAPRAAEQREQAEPGTGFVERAGRTGPVPTVAVERLFRDDPRPSEGAARARTPGCRENSDLLADDTVRLRRFTSGATGAPACATPDDHRSE
ncbi:ATP-binding cassette domain-containing protein [Streptomyces sp. NRRL S-350]|uniref:ATP-binding cassette domain-containing protein n=1 Tax=Streptomyces sp. NRRL S-350 TaxID=1463902 RepID=UPI00068BDEC4|nr:ATP-binding cassette domain-containing protein [Streptomyces sp. NRRL S-350]